MPKSLNDKLRFYPLLALKMCVLRNVDAIVVEGTAQKRHLEALNVPSEKVFFSNHCSLDYSLVESQNLKQKLNIKKELVVLYLGQIIRRKGLDVLIEAFSAIEREKDNAFLLICGDGDFRPFCEQLAKQLKIRHFCFLGTIPERDIASYYRTSDLFVLPSCVRSDQKVKGEGWGLVINEALSMGLPVIATNVVGATPDLVRNGFNGYTVKNGNVEDLCLALRKILGNENLRKIMGENSRRIFEEFNDFDKMFNGFRQAIEYAFEHDDISTAYR
jgi:glycosyltransferase involved in cell wall biosynthesis